VTTLLFGDSEAICRSPWHLWHLMLELNPGEVYFEVLEQLEMSCQWAYGLTVCFACWRVDF